MRCVILGISIHSASFVCMHAQEKGLPSSNCPESPAGERSVFNGFVKDHDATTFVSLKSSFIAQTPRKKKVSGVVKPAET